MGNDKASLKIRLNPLINSNHYFQQKVDTRIPVMPIIRLPTKEEGEYVYFKLTCAIQHLGTDFASGHYIAHLLDEESNVYTVDDQCPEGRYIRAGTMDGVERSSLFFFKKIDYNVEL